MHHGATELLVIIAVTVFVTFVLSLSYLRSVSDAALVLMHVPFAFVPGILASRFTGARIGIAACIGVLSVLGVAVLNGVLLIGGIRQRRQGGTPLKEAVRQGAELRLRPVLMTALLVMVGALPAALSSGIGSNEQQLLAIVVIGGILSATLFTLLVLPASYICLHSGERVQTMAPGHVQGAPDGKR